MAAPRSPPARHGTSWRSDVARSRPGARAIAANVPVVGHETSGHIALFPADQGLPGTSMVNYRAGQVRANNAIVGLNGDRELSVFCGQPSGTVDFILDVVGNFDRFCRETGARLRT
ncbi:MAG: hypothetical protein ABR576_16830 [Thermoanaerobaculia bacterium]